MKPGRKPTFATIAEMQQQIAAMADDTVSAVFGARVKERRLALKMTQEDLARACCVSRVSIANFEVGRTRCTISRLVLLCSALQCSADYLLGIKDS